MVNQSKRKAPHKIGLGLVIMVVLLVGGWRLLIIARHAHIMAIATEVGSIAEFGQGRDGDLFPNNKGTALTFFRMTETGLGTHFCNAASGGSKLLFEQQEKGYIPQFGMLGWSPDDRYFACLIPMNPDRSKKDIVVYDGVSGEPQARIPGENCLWDSRFVWLSDHSFVYSSHGRTLILVEQKPDGQWTQRLGGRLPNMSSKEVAGGGIKNLTATSTHSVAWQQQGEIWTYDFNSGSSAKIWESTTNQLEDFTLDPETGDYQLTCSDATSPIFYQAANLTFYQLHPPEKWLPQSGFLNKIRNDQRARYAELSEDQGLYSFSIRSNGKSEPRCFKWQGIIGAYKLGGDQLFFTGNLPGEPPALWQYDVNSQDLHQLVSSLSGRLKHTTIAASSSGVITNTSGNPVNYHLWKPAQASPEKKYPLLIGQTHYDFNVWFPYQQVAVNAGYYFATADRISWFDGLDKWVPDVTALYETLAKDPNIDTNRVFLIGISWETSFVANLVAEKPDLWKGAVLLDAVSLPDLSNSRFTKVFIADGRAGDINPIERIIKYQDGAARAGIPVKLVLQEGVQHITRSIATERERTRQFARFLLESQ